MSGKSDENKSQWILNLRFSKVKFELKIIVRDNHSNK